MTKNRHEDCIAYTLNWPEATKFFLKIMFRGIVTQSSNNEGLERVATDVWVLIGFI